jgi:hypothetical protein
MHTERIDFRINFSIYGIIVANHAICVQQDETQRAENYYRMNNKFK